LKARSIGWIAPLAGFYVGGCLFPVLLFFFCLFVLNDIGGPLFWPVAAMFFAVVGAFIGALVDLFLLQPRRMKRSLEGKKCDCELRDSKPPETPE
jgi:hypothetical protein